MSESEETSDQAAAPASVIQEDGRIHVPLADPIEVTVGQGSAQRTERVETLKFVRPRLKHLKERDRAHGDVEALARIFAAMAGLKPNDLDELSVEDFTRVEAALVPFFEGSKLSG